MTKKKPEVIRITHLEKTLDTIQNVFKAMGGNQQKMAEIVINAVRMTYGIPADGEQIELFKNDK
jgi:hypothetical protein